MPASPVTRMTRPSTPDARWAATIAASAAPRPTSGRRVRTGTGAGTAPDVPLAPTSRSAALSARVSRIASYSSVVSASGATPSSRSSTPTQVRYWRIAAARSPERASRAISRRWAPSSSGSRSTRRSAAARAAATVPVGLRDGGEPVQHRGDGPLDGDRARGTPVVELGAVAEREPGQERAAGVIGGRLEHGLIGGCRGPLELVEVHPRRRDLESDRRAVHLQPAVAERRAEHGQRPTQRTARRLVVRLRPQQGGDLLARERPALRGQQRQDRQRLARIDDERRPVDRDLERAEDADRRGRCRGPVSSRFAMPSGVTVPRGGAIS